MDRTLTPRWIYFSAFIILASQGRFISLVLLDSLKLTDSQVGIVLGAGIVAGMLLTPVWSKLADNPKYGCLFMLRFLMIAHFFAYLIMPLASIVGDETGKFVLVIFSRFTSAGCMLGKLDLTVW
jgi:hypothetical protein